MPRPHLAVFDLDGTLVDTLASIGAAMNAVLREEGLPEHPVDAYRKFAGDGARALVRRATGGRFDEDPARIDSLAARFRTRDEKTDAALARPYRGIPEAIEALRRAEVRMAVLSNKGHAEADALVERLFPGEPFEHVLGAGGRFPLKPDPAALRWMIEQERVSASHCVFIGDTNTDMITGTAAGVRTIGCLWGFRDADELVASGADDLAKTPYDLPGLLLDI